MVNYQCTSLLSCPKKYPTHCYSTKERDQRTHFMILSNVGNISTNSLKIYQLTRRTEISLLLLRKKYSICNIFCFVYWISGNISEVLFFKFIKIYGSYLKNIWVGARNYNFRGMPTEHSLAYVFNCLSENLCGHPELYLQIIITNINSKKWHRKRTVKWW